MKAIFTDHALKRWDERIDRSKTIQQSFAESTPVSKHKYYQLSQRLRIQKNTILYQNCKDNVIFLVRIDQRKHKPVVITCVHREGDDEYVNRSSV